MRDRVREVGNGYQQPYELPCKHTTYKQMTKQGNASGKLKKPFSFNAQLTTFRK